MKKIVLYLGMAIFAAAGAGVALFGGSMWGSTALLSLAFVFWLLAEW